MSKSVKRVVKKSPAKKVVTKKVTKKVDQIKMDKDGRRITLRQPQLQILNLLQNKPNGLPLQQIAEKISISLSEHLGSVRGAKNKYTVSLLEQRMVTIEEAQNKAGKTVWVAKIAKAGCAALNDVG